MQKKILNGLPANYMKKVEEQQEKLRVLHA